MCNKELEHSFIIPKKICLLSNEVSDILYLGCKDDHSNPWHNHLSNFLLSLGTPQCKNIYHKYVYSFVHMNHQGTLVKMQ